MPIEHRVREALDAYMARVRHDMDAHVRSLTSDLLRIFSEQLPHHPGRAKDAVDTVERLVGSVRRIDTARSLTAIIEALVQGAADETSRVAVMLVEGDHLKVWGHRGFVTGTAPTDMPLGASGTLAAAVAGRQSSFVPSLIEGRAHTVPAFMRVPVGFTGIVIPMIVGGDVVALLYADDVDRAATHEDAPVWTEEVELLARHASICLERVTSVRTVEVLARPG